MPAIKLPSAHRIVQFILVLIFLTIAALGVLAWKQSQADLAYQEINEALPAMITEIASAGWSDAAMRKHLDPRRVIKTEGRAPHGPPLFQALGPVKSFKGMQSQSTSDFTDVQAVFAFENGDALVKLRMVKVDGIWRMDGKIGVYPITYSKPAPEKAN